MPVLWKQHEATQVWFLVLQKPKAVFEGLDLTLKLRLELGLGQGYEVSWDCYG